MSNVFPTEGLHIKRDAAMGFSYLNIEDQATNPIFKVHENGNVGIGTVTPRAPLDVAGDEGIIVDGKGSSSEMRFRDAGTDG